MAEEMKRKKIAVVGMGGIGTNALEDIAKEFAARGETCEFVLIDAFQATRKKTDGVVRDMLPALREAGGNFLPADFRTYATKPLAPPKLQDNPTDDPAIKATNDKALAEYEALKLAYPPEDHETHLAALKQDMKDVDAVVVTAGVPRKNGQTRADLIAVNAGIIGDVVETIGGIPKTAKVVMCPNPLDAMVTIASQKMEEKGFAPTSVIGMAGILDSSRAEWILHEELSNLGLKEPGTVKISVPVLGEHGGEMVPVFSQAKIGNQSWREYAAGYDLDVDGIEARVAERTKAEGAKVIELQGTSCIRAAAHMLTRMTLATLGMTKEPLACQASVRAAGDEVAYGKMVEIGTDGAKILPEPELDAGEKSLLEKSVGAIKAALNEFKELMARKTLAEEAPVGKEAAASR